MLSPHHTFQTILFSFLFCGAALIAVKAAVREPTAVPTAASGTPSAVVMIDPGHGGEDGGASDGGVLEKGLNLAVAADLADYFDLFGIPAAMTRTEDTMLYDAYGDLADYKGHKKSYDLRNRLRMTEESGARLLVSVHMNKFPQPSTRGMQIYYSPNTPESASAASVLRSYGQTYLSPDNRRETKKATDAIYLLKRAKMPAVLVECGFLSNPDERALLVTPAYQEKVAAVLFAGIAEYLAQS